VSPPVERPDPEVIARLLARNKTTTTPSSALAARTGGAWPHGEGRSNAAIGQQLVITERAWPSTTASIFLRLDSAVRDDNGRVLAVMATWAADGPTRHSQFPLRLLIYSSDRHLGRAA